MLDAVEPVEFLHLERPQRLPAGRLELADDAEQVASTLRVELFEDTKGVRTGFEGLYTEVTYGVAWKVMPGLILRPSVRYDNNNVSAPFEGSQNLFTGYMDFIIRW
ncbi:MAG TPA: outer membrane beta-barrel protein [Gemmataceae bacterium]|nr:outer membrane beta-barrel protein [Gemmataceae bacterium]